MITYLVEWRTVAVPRWVPYPTAYPYPRLGWAERMLPRLREQFPLCRFRVGRYRREVAR